MITLPSIARGRDGRFVRAIMFCVFMCLRGVAKSARQNCGLCTTERK